MRAVLSLAVMVILAGSIMAQSKTDLARARAIHDAQGFRLKGGVINVAEGDIRCVCEGKTTGIEPRQELTDGDAILTGAGQVEILLNPGYYLRLAGNAEARFVDLSPGNLKIQLARGSAIFEIPINSSYFPYQDIRDPLFQIVTVITPHDEFAITREGGYRFDVTPGTESRVRVFKGTVVVAGNIIKAGKAATVLNGKVNLAPADKSPDAFDSWSRDRARSLVRSNQSLRHMEWYKTWGRSEEPLGVAEVDAPADDTSMYTVSARNGVVTFMERGTILQKGSSDWRPLESGATLSDGDRVRTERNNRAEIHPLPDFNFYLGSNTEILYSESPDGNVAITVAKGSVVLVVLDTDLKDQERNQLRLIANQAAFEIEKPGYYRLNLLSSENSEMRVYDGTARFAGKEIKATRTLVLNGPGAREIPLSREDQDAFGVWSERRSLRSQSSEARRRHWFAGAWFLDPRTNEFTFVPGGRTCQSPYGGEYSVDFNAAHPPFQRRLESREPFSGIKITSP